MKEVYFDLELNKFYILMNEPTESRDITYRVYVPLNKLDE